MHHKYYSAIIILALCSFTITLPMTLPVVKLNYPDSWPQPVYDLNQKPLIRAQVELGRRLFYDPILSSDNSISCSSCHLSYTAFAHTDHSLSHGIHDSIGIRNAPTLINIAWQKVFMWDGAINDIALQGLAPINHASEMGESTVHVLQKLNNSPLYKEYFLEAFGDTIVTVQMLLNALAQFQMTFLSSNSRYDKMKRGELTFNTQERNGYQLFLKHCNSCHQEPLFTNHSFQNNGLSVDSTLNDWGRYRVTKQSKDSLLFKVPSLRNIEFSFPYMHDGRFRSLSQVMTHYQNGIVPSPNLAPSLQGGIELAPNDKADLIAFLLTLTDKEFLFNRKYSFPRD